MSTFPGGTKLVSDIRNYPQAEVCWYEIPRNTFISRYGLSPQSLKNSLASVFSVLFISTRYFSFNKFYLLLILIIKVYMFIVEILEYAKK